VVASAVGVAAEAQSAFIWERSVGGTLQVESEPGRGTRIRASFPSSNVSEQPAEPEE
jgi:hypothetical protein